MSMWEEYQAAAQAAKTASRQAGRIGATDVDRHRAYAAKQEMLRLEGEYRKSAQLNAVIPAEIQQQLADRLLATIRQELKDLLPHPLRGLTENYTDDEAPLMASLDAQGQAYWGPAPEGGGGEWSGRVLDLHGTVIFELNPEASPPVVIGNVYLLIDTTKEGEDAVSFSSSVGAVPRYITYEVGVYDGAGGYTKKSGYVCGDIRVPLILGGDEFSVLTQTEGTGGIDMGYLRAIGGSVP